MITKEEREKIFGKAIAQVIHDIRNPLNIVIGYSSILQIDETINDEIRSYIQNILYSGYKIEELISNIDNFVSDEDNQPAERFKILPEWNRFLKQKANEINDKKINIIAKIEENIEINFIKENFFYLLNNLFAFSLKGMKKNAANEVLLKIERDEKNIVFYYSDSTSPIFIENNYFTYDEIQSCKRGLYPLFIEKIINDANGSVCYFFGKKWNDLTEKFFDKKTSHGFIFYVPQDFR